MKIQSYFIPGTKGIFEKSGTQAFDKAYRGVAEKRNGFRATEHLWDTPAAQRVALVRGSVFLWSRPPRPTVGIVNSGVELFSKIPEPAPQPNLAVNNP